jgi:hypothetical protein
MYFLKRILAIFIPDRLYVKLAFFKSHGWWPRTPPVTFNEYLCELKASGGLAPFQRFADKHAVRDHVARKIGSAYLVPLYATAKRFTRELWNELPNAFVVKTNHGSNWNRIVRNKGDEDFSSLAAQTDAWLKKNFYYVRREHQYKNIRPLLMVEQILSEDGGQAIKDYKFFCFRGKACFILVTGAGVNNVNTYYDRNWRLLDIVRTNGTEEAVSRPDKLVEMIEVAEKLSEDFVFVRVDLYCVEDKIYFSELTFVPGGGSGRFNSVEFEECAGRLWAGEDVDLTRFHVRKTAAELSVNSPE